VDGSPIAVEIRAGAEVQEGTQRGTSGSMERGSSGSAEPGTIGEGQLPTDPGAAGTSGSSGTSGSGRGY